MSFKYISNANTILRAIEKEEKTRIKEASKHVQRAVKKRIRKRKTVSKPGEVPRGKTGNLKKGVKYKIHSKGYYALVGFGKPAYHAHLLEPGTGRRHFRGRNRGQIEGRDLLASVIKAEQPTVQRILGGRWI